MKFYNVILFVFFFISSNSWSQDILEKINGDTMVVKVLEIDEYRLLYKFPNEENGPKRIIRKEWVYKITYHNGIVEVFNEKRVITDRRMKLYNKKIKPEGVLSSGFYFDGLNGFSTGTLISHYSGSLGELRQFNYFFAGMRIGNKWYFGKNEKYRFGINTEWLRVGMLVDDSDFGGLITPLSLGMASVIGVNKNSSIELSTVTGVSVIRLDRFPIADLALGIDLKYRYKKLSVGLDYLATMSFTTSESLHFISFTTGVRF